MLVSSIHSHIAYTCVQIYKLCKHLTCDVLPPCDVTVHMYLVIKIIPSDVTMNINFKQFSVIMNVIKAKYMWMLVMITMLMKYLLLFQH